MALEKVTYYDSQTVIYASNLNAIQDEIISNATNISTKVPNTRKINNKILNEDIVLEASDFDDVVPNTRKINNKELNADVALTASDVDAVPDTRKINNYELSVDVTLNKSDVGLGNVANIDQSGAITGITRSGTTFTATKLDGTTTTFDQQDSHYASTTVVNSTNTSTTDTSTALTNDNVYMNHVENGAVVGSHKIKGTGGSTVTTDASGNILVNTTVDTTGTVRFDVAQSLTDAYKQQARTNIGQDILNLQMMGMRPRFKDITSYFTDGTLWNRIAGTGYPCEYYDICPGDYFDMGRAVTCPDSGETGAQWVTVISCGGEMYVGTSSDNVTYPHLVMVPGKGKDTSVKQHFGTHAMNSTATAVGGYKNSEMFTDVLGAPVSAGSIATGATINQQLYYIFGSHLKTYSDYVSKEIDTSKTNRFGTASGASSGYEWASVQSILLSEIELYGSIVWASSGFDAGAGTKQFEGFQMSRELMANGTTSMWLRDVFSQQGFVRCASNGVATYRAATYVNGVRPRFILA